MRIRDLNPQERPREKLLANGVSFLSDSELLAVILRTGVKGKNAIDFSRELLAEHGLEKLSLMPPSQLKRTAGLGLAKASSISASFELSKRVIKSRSQKR